MGALRPMMSGGVPLDFEKADPEKDVFGAGKIEDFTWKGLLDFATCTECGRCQSQCPAWNTGEAVVAEAGDAGAARSRVRQGAVPLAGRRRDDLAGAEKLSGDLQASWPRDPLAMLEAGGR